MVGEGWLPWLGLVKRDLLFREGLVRAIWFVFLFSFFLSFTVWRRWECGVSFLCRGSAESSPGSVQRPDSAAARRALGWGRRAGLALGERRGRGCIALPSARSQAPA